MSMLKRLWWAGLFGIALTGTVFFLGCEALPFEFDVPVQSSTTIEKGTLLETVIGDFGFTDLTTFDISDTQQFKNNNAQKDQVVTAKLTKLTLSISEPSAFQSMWSRSATRPAEETSPSLPRSSHQ